MSIFCFLVLSFSYFDAQFSFMCFILYCHVPALTSLLIYMLPYNSVLISYCHLSVRSLLGFVLYLNQTGIEPSIVAFVVSSIERVSNMFLLFTGSAARR